MLRLMLDHHPRIAFSNEFEYAVDFISEDGHWPDLETFYHRLARNRIFQDQGYQIDRSLSYPALVDSFLCQRRNRVGKQRVGASVHRHFDRLPRIWPDARYVHLIRDGRDVARSCISMGWAGNVWTGAQRWIEAEQTWKQLQTTLSSDRYVEVRYEDLVANPESELDRICVLIGERFEPAMLSYAEHSTYDRPDPQYRDQWRRKLSESEVRLIEARIGPMLVDRGYELSGLPPRNVTPWLQWALRRQDRLARIRHRMRTLGWQLYLEDVIARRFGPQTWRDRVRFRVNDAIRATLK